MSEPVKVLSVNHKRFKANFDLVPTRMVQCKQKGKWVLTLAQETGICKTCGRSIFNSKRHRA